MPVVSTTGSRHDKTYCVVVSSLGSFNRTTTFQIDSGCPGYFRIRIGGDEVTRDPVKHIEEAILGGLHDDFTHYAIKWNVREHQRLHGGVIPVVCGSCLVVPFDAAVIHVQRYYRRQIQVVTFTIAAQFVAPR